MKKNVISITGIEEFSMTREQRTKMDPPCPTLPMKKMRVVYMEEEEMAITSSICIAH